MKRIASTSAILYKSPRHHQHSLQTLDAPDGEKRKNMPLPVHAMPRKQMTTPTIASDLSEGCPRVRTIHALKSSNKFWLIVRDAPCNTGSGEKDRL